MADVASLARHNATVIAKFFRPGRALHRDRSEQLRQGPPQSSSPPAQISLGTCRHRRSRADRSETAFRPAREAPARRFRGSAAAMTAASAYGQSLTWRPSAVKPGAPGLAAVLESSRLTKDEECAMKSLITTGILAACLALTGNAAMAATTQIHQPVKTAHLSPARPPGCACFSAEASTRRSTQCRYCAIHPGRAWRRPGPLCQSDAGCREHAGVSRILGLFAVL